MKLAIDDGYAYTKLAWLNEEGKLKAYSMKSDAQAGVHGMTTISGDPVDCYESDGQKFTVGPVMQPESTHTDEYPFSPLNRCIIHHAILESKVPYENPLSVGLTLPLQQFYKMAGVRERRIKALTDKTVQCLSDSTVKMPSFEQVKVFPEGAVAWIDAYVAEDGSTVRNLDDIGPVAIVDIGGRTTDLAVFPRKGVIDQERSGTEGIGVTDILKHICAALASKFGTSDLSMVQAEKALRTNVVRHFKEHNVSDVVAEAKEQVAERIIRAILKHLDKLSEYEEVVFIGGGAEILKPFLDQREDFPLARVLPEPAFANARGVLKFMTYIDEQ